MILLKNNEPFSPLKFNAEGAFFGTLITEPFLKPFKYLRLNIKHPSLKLKVAYCGSGLNIFVMEQKKLPNVVN